MSDETVISLSDVRHRQQLATSSFLPDASSGNATGAELGSGAEATVVTLDNLNVAGGYLSAAAVLRKLNPDTELSRFFDLTESCIAVFKQCQTHIEAGELLEADNQFMAARQIIAELFVLRETSDAVGVVVLATLKATTRVTVVTDAPDLSSALIKGLSRLWHSPFMEFLEAAQIAADIEAAANTEEVEAFGALVNELLHAQPEAGAE